MQTYNTSFTARVGKAYVQYNVADPVEKTGLRKNTAERLRRLKNATRAPTATVQQESFASSIIDSEEFIMAAVNRMRDALYTMVNVTNENVDESLAYLMQRLNDITERPKAVEQPAIEAPPVKQEVRSAQQMEETTSKKIIKATKITSAAFNFPDRPLSHSIKMKLYPGVNEVYDVTSSSFLIGVTAQVKTYLASNSSATYTVSRVFKTERRGLPPPIDVVEDEDQSVSTLSDPGHFTMIREKDDLMTTDLKWFRIRNEQTSRWVRDEFPDMEELNGTIIVAEPPSVITVGVGLELFHVYPLLIEGRRPSQLLNGNVVESKLIESVDWTAFVCGDKWFVNLAWCVPVEVELRFGL